MPVFVSFVLLRDLCGLLIAQSRGHKDHEEAQRTRSYMRLSSRRCARNDSNSFNEKLLRFLSFGNPPFCAANTPYLQTSNSSIECASGSIEKNAPFSNAYSIHRQSISRRRGLALISIVTLFSTQAS